MKNIASDILVQQSCHSNVNQTALNDSRLIRRAVFIEEQGVTEEEEWDDADSNHHTVHFTAYHKNCAVACGRICIHESTIQLGRLAVIKPMRMHGVGATLLRHMLIACLRHPKANIVLNSQNDVVGWYQKFSFEAIGTIFMDAGIPHQKMVFNRKHHLDSIYKDMVVRLEDINECQTRTQHLLNSSKYKIDIFSHDLKCAIFRQSEIVSQISVIARRHKNSLVRILIRDSEFLAHKEHPLVSLQQKLPSKIQIRLVTIKPTNDLPALISADNTRLLFMENEQEGIGFINFSAQAEIRHFMLEYNDLWDRHSRTDPNLSALYI